MLDEISASTLMLALASVIGLPFFIRRHDLQSDGVPASVLLAPATGFISMMLITVLLVETESFGTRNLLIALFIVLMVGVAFWFASPRSVDSKPAKMPVWSVVVAIGVAGLFLAATANAVYFIYQVADFGEYLNSANQLLAGEGFGEWFVNGYPALLALGGSLVGEAHAVSVMPAIAVAFALAVSFIPWHFRMHPVVGISVLVVALAHPLSVWFGRFPASEAAYAMVLALALGLWLRHVQSGYRHHLFPLALAGISLSLIRGNAAILAPVLITVTLIVLASGVGSALKRALSRNATIWLAGGIALGLAYDIAMNRPYVVDYQFAEFTPSSVERLLIGISTPQYAIILIAGILLAWLLLNMACRIGDSKGRQWIVWASAIGILTASTIPVLVGLFSDSDPLPFGHFLIVGSALITVSIGGAFVALRSPLRSIERTHTGLLAWFLFTVFIAFQAMRLSTPHNVDAPWFLYWQRYYLSEVFPAALVLAVFFFDWLTDWFTERTRTRSSTRLFGQTAVVLVAFTIVASVATGTIAAATVPMFGDARRDLETVALAADETMDEAGSDHIYWFAMSDERLLSFWPNTHRPLALPLHETFGVSVLIGNSHVFALVPTAPDIELRCTTLAELTSSAPAAIAVAAGAAVTPDDIGVGCSEPIDVESTGTAVVTIERTTWISSVPANRQPVVEDTVVVSYFVVSRGS